MHNLRKLALLVRSRRLWLVLRVVARRLYSDNLSLGLRRDVSAPFDAPGTPAALTIRPIEPDDVPLFTDVSVPNLAQESVLVRANARYLIDAGIRTCYVAVTRAGRPCYMQCLIDPSQNEKLRELYGDLMPLLRNDEGLLEAACSLEKYRGRGLMLHVIPELAKKARELGLGRLILFASVNNQAMLRACKWTGFAPYVERRESYRLFRRRVTFAPLPNGAPYPFDTAAEDRCNHASGGA